MFSKNTCKYLGIVTATERNTNGQGVRLNFIFKELTNI